MTAAGSKYPAAHIYAYYSDGRVTVAFVENALLDVLGNESSGCKKTLICTIIHAPFNDCWRTAFFFDSLAVPRCVFHRHSPMVSSTAFTHYPLTHSTFIFNGVLRVRLCTRQYGNDQSSHQPRRSR